MGNIKNVKDHYFYNKYSRDRYAPDEIEYKPFNANIEQALVWKCLETGTHNQDNPSNRLLFIQLFSLTNTDMITSVISALNIFS